MGLIQQQRHCYVQWVVMLTVISVFCQVAKYTPIEGTPYCFSRNSPLSSLDSSDAESDHPVDTMKSIAEAHQVSDRFPPLDLHRPFTHRP